MNPFDEKLTIKSEGVDESPKDEDFGFDEEVKDEETRKREKEEAEDWWGKLKKRMKANQ